MTPADRAGAAQVAATLAGASLTRAQAERVAAAVLRCADGKLQVREAAWREYWDTEGFRDHVRKSMRHALLEGVLEKGLVPVALPSETVRYVMTSALPGGFRVSAGGGPASGVEVPESAPWDSVDVVLEVPVRVP